MKATIRNVKISEIPTAIEQLGLSAHACVDFTIENHEMTGNEQEETTQALMEVVNEIRVDWPHNCYKPLSQTGKRGYFRGLLTSCF